MAKNHIQEGVVIDWTNGTGSDVTSGSAVVIGVLVCVALGNIANGETGRVATEQVFELPKNTSLAINQGDRCYWDVADGNINKTAVDNIDAGVAVADAGTSDATVRIKLNA
ncbi:hypothetical protein DGMP_06570 [Desulfomarina profundi]|uniref:DUF2190 family protein n=1 Tax=Desulfomarina profundi TaxID=2772557 RepID=A0A8D5FQL3_9BACT|nr:DUF2190 family protein [Desulfomarina profundi]BCL59964.1 hypothetical protein DGMP_06570 [Desulfomarina profundi]